MALGADDVEAAGLHNLVVALLPFLLDLCNLLLGRVLEVLDLLLPVAAEDDIGSAACHVGGDGDRLRSAGLGDDLGLARVVLRVEDLVLDALRVKEAGELLGVLDGDGADEDRPALPDLLDNILYDSLVLVLVIKVDGIRIVDSDHRLVGRDDHGVEPVDLLELVCLGIGGSGHAGELLVEAEVVLEGDGGEGLVLCVDLDSLLCLDRLVESLGPAAAGHGASGLLVDDDDLSVLHDVVNIAVEEDVRAERLHDMMEDHHVVRREQGVVLTEEAGLLQELLDIDLTVLGEVGLLGLEIDGVVALAVVGLGVLLVLLLEVRDDLVDLAVKLGAVLRGAGDDERGAGLVDEHGVNLIHESVVERALDALLLGVGEVVAEVIEAELVVGSVEHVAGVGGALALGVKPVGVAGNGHAEELEEGL